MFALVRLPRNMKSLFWNVEFRRLDADRDADFVLARVLERGRLRDVRWVIRHYGIPRIRRFFVGLAGKFGVMTLPWSGPLQVNGLPGYVSRDPTGTLQATALQIEDGRITAVYIMRNPDKLGGAEGFLG